MAHTYKYILSIRLVFLCLTIVFVSPHTFGGRPKIEPRISSHHLQETCKNESGEAITLTEKDKSDIIKLVFEDAVVTEKVFEDDSRPKGKRPTLLLSTINIKKSWLPKLPRLRLELLGQRDLREMHEYDGNFHYLEFSAFKVKGACVTISLSNKGVHTKGREEYYYSGKGINYECRKESGKWTIKEINRWISIT